MPPAVPSALPRTRRTGPDPIESGLAHHRAGDLARAERDYRRVLAAHPREPAALHLLGVVALERGRTERALQLIEKALKGDPGHPDYLHSAGQALHALGGLEEAAARYRAALAADPGRAVTRCNLGNVLRRLDRPDEAVTELRAVVDAEPGFAEAWSNLGLAEKARRRFEAAIACFQRATSLRPDIAAFPFNLGNTLMEAGRCADAVAAYGDVLEREPAHRGALTGFGAALRRTGEIDSARTALTFACTRYPDDPELRWNLGLAHLMAGDWQAGFEAFEARLSMAGYGLPGIDAPRWDGRPRDGATLLIAHEQGLGDALQFLRFARDAADSGAHVIYRGPRALLPLAAGIDGIAATAALDEPPPACDCWVPLMSLPHVLGATTSGDLSRGGYLRADEARAARWRERLRAIDGIRIGICWQGNPSYGADAERSIPLQHFEALARLPGVTLVSLQKGHGTEQLRDWPAGLPLADLGPVLDLDGGAFMDSAALLPVLDLVVTSDTALVHLAGALGVGAFLALPRVPDWRWGLEGPRTVWYPSVQVFRQRHPGDWDRVFEDMTEALGARIGVHHEKHG